MIVVIKNVDQGEGSGGLALRAILVEEHDQPVCGLFAVRETEMGNGPCGERPTLRT